MRAVLAHGRTSWAASKKAMLLLATFPLRLALLIAIIICASRA